MTPTSMKKRPILPPRYAKKASIPPCFSTVLGGQTGGTVPKKGEHSVFFFDIFLFHFSRPRPKVIIHILRKIFNHNSCSIQINFDLGINNPTEVVNSFLENLEMVPDTDQEILEIISWKALSRSLSRGVQAEFGNEKIRIVGIDVNGFFLIEADGHEIVVSDSHSVTWRY